MNTINKMILILIAGYILDIISFIVTILLAIKDDKERKKNGKN